MLIQVATLTGLLAEFERLADTTTEWIARTAGGKLLGSWQTEIGSLGRIHILRHFETAEEMAEEYRRLAASSTPFNDGSALRTLELKSYEAFIGNAAPRDGNSVYEMRTYFVKPGGLPPLMNSWKETVPGAGDYGARLVIAMYGLSGRPRIRHIWCFESFEQRNALRRDTIAAGTWPPPEGADQIVDATSELMLPLLGSPLR